MSTNTGSRPAGTLTPPVDDPIYRAVVAANDPAVMTEVIAAEWARAGVPTHGMKARVILAHYRPRIRARLIVRAEIEREGRKRPRVQFLFLQVYPTAAAARRRFGHVLKQPLKCTGPAVFLVEAWSAVAWALPNGPMLRTTKMLLRRPKFSRFLAEAGLVPREGRRPRTPELIRYVPRHRAVFRHAKPDDGKTGPIYIKVYSPGGDVPAARHLELARGAAVASGAFEVPLLVAHVARRRALVMKEIPGRRLTEHVASPDGAAFRAAGRALAALHHAAIRPHERWSAEREVHALGVAMHDVARALPALRERIDGCLNAAGRMRAQLVFPESLPIHGNMFADQVLVGDGLSIGIVDWDDLCLGDPLYDVGRLAAHALFLVLREDEGASMDCGPVVALLDGYSSAGGEIESRRLRWHVAVALLIRAKISALRALPPTWISDIERSLEAAGTLLDELSAGTTT